MNQPTWSKIPDVLENLIDTPWDFSLFKALTLLEESWADGNELETGVSKRIQIAPYKELGFPASDVRRCELLVENRGVIRLETSYLGLYGVDSPLPHFVVEQAAQDDDAGKRTRAFLDMFNHVIYCQLFQSWKKSQLTINGCGSNQFDQIIDALLANSQQRKISSGVASLKQNSASGLAQLLRAELNEPTLILDDLRAYWQTVDQPSILGDDDSMILGHSLILSDKVLATGTLIGIDMGPMSPEAAKEYSPRQPKGQQLASLLDNQLPHGTPWKCHLKVAHSGHKISTLGTSSIVLGFDSYLGNALPTTQTLTFSHGQYH